MNKKPIQIAAVVILSSLIMCELGYIAGRNFSDIPQKEEYVDVNILGQITSSGKNIKINNEQIPSYSVSDIDEIYFADADLELFGFCCELSDDTYVLSNPSGEYTMSSDSFVGGLEGTDAYETEYKLKIADEQFDCCQADKVVLIPSAALESLGSKLESEVTNTIYYAFGTDEQIAAAEEMSQKEIDMAQGMRAETNDNNEPKTEIALNDDAGHSDSSVDSTSSAGNIIVIDPGHGKSSSLMSADEKRASGWVQNSAGAWGEWRHYKSGSSTVDCGGSGCSGRVTPNGACWYPIGNGDRATEPDINLNNALAAKKYLEQMGYTVRMTRTTNDENPSITRRLSYCYPNNDTSLTADAQLFLCIHSNAGGGRGSAYISLEGLYDQRGISSTYVSDGNRLGQLCNDSIVSNTSMPKCGNGIISFEPELIAFCKSPVACGYLEIGFFDNSADLNILRSESDAIGKAIAQGIDTYIKTK